MISPFFRWDYEAVLDVIHANKNVVLVLAGHDHNGGYVEQNGVHFVTFPSPMVSKNKYEDQAHGIIDIYQDRIEIIGRGTVETRTLSLK